MCTASITNNYVCYIHCTCTCNPFTCKSAISTHCASLFNNSLCGDKHITILKFWHIRATKYCSGSICSLGKSLLMEGERAWSSPSISSLENNVGSSPHDIRLFSSPNISVFANCSS